MSEQKSFFSTLPGILTGLAGLVTAIVALIYALSAIGVIGSGEKDQPQPGASPPTRNAYGVRLWGRVLTFNIL